MTSRRRAALLVLVVGGLLAVVLVALVDDDDEGAPGDGQAVSLAAAASTLDCEEATSEASPSVYTFTSTFDCAVEHEFVRVHGFSPESRTQILTSLAAGKPLSERERKDPLPPCAVVLVSGFNWVALAGSLEVGEIVAERTGGRQQPTTTAGPPVSYPFCPGSGKLSA